MNHMSQQLVHLGPFQYLPITTVTNILQPTIFLPTGTGHVAWPIGRFPPKTTDIMEDSLPPQPTKHNLNRYGQDQILRFPPPSHQACSWSIKRWAFLRADSKGDNRVGTGICTLAMLPWVAGPAFNNFLSWQHWRKSVQPQERSFGT